MVQFDNSYARLPDRFFSRIAPEEAPAPEVMLFNAPLAAQLGVEDWGAAELSGNHLPDGADPIAQVYAAHQFGNWVPRLGDGRAILLGEVQTETGRFDIQLKGAGRTPYSRNGDGRAWIGPALREYLMSEFMHRLGVPTTRALAVTRSGNRVQRERAYPGAVLTRVASSHIRVGTFQYFSSHGDQEAIELLIAHVRDRHFPQAAQGVLGLYQEIIEAQAQLIAKWMGFGFVHGVMNTDNMAISGETIDYGPCAFIDAFSGTAVYSSIDHQGRYAYGQQARIAHWNLAQLGSCLIEIASAEHGSEETAIEALSEVLNSFQPRFEKAYKSVFAQKLGLNEAQIALDDALIADFMTLLDHLRGDFTNVFYALSQGEVPEGFEGNSAFEIWHDRWMSCCDGAPDKEAMKLANPALIARTHRIEEAIQAAVEGDDAPALRLAKALETPFEVSAENQELRRPPKADEIVAKTFCGT